MKCTFSKEMWNAWKINDWKVLVNITRKICKWKPSCYCKKLSNYFLSADSACLKKKIHRYRINYSTANIFIACFVQIEILKSVIHNVHQGITHSIYSYLSQQMNCNFWFRFLKPESAAEKFEHLHRKSDIQEERSNWNSIFC